MREIKFRAWDKEYKTITKVLLINFERGALLQGLPVGEELEYLNHENGDYTILVAGQRFRDFDKIELMQFVGLKDKNGKEIYEGDILLCDNDGEQYKTEIRWSDGGLIAEMPDGADYDLSLIGWVIEELTCCNGSVEIIGNVYKNPELLKGEG
jgi:uncharacterized phage protein (TIGR01671 family)